MTKRPSSGKGGGPLRVRSSDGSRQPFLRGMVTHDLVLRGLPFVDAYATARALRDRLADREEITTEELRNLVRLQVEEMFGAERARNLRTAAGPAADLLVERGEERPVPFSRGILAQSLLAVGLDLDRAYRLVVEVQRELASAGLERVDGSELARWVADLLQRREGKETALRYRALRRVRRLQKPLIVYLGGATGSGKSTLALELAPELRVSHISATDTIRQVMRMVFSPAILPALHHSSFEGAPGVRPFERAEQEGDESDLIAAFEEQATRVCVGVRAVVERAIAERVSMLIEGVHLMPGIVPFPDLEGEAHQLMVLLTTVDEEVHRRRLLTRGPRGAMHPERYVEHLGQIRKLQEYLMERADEEDVPLLDTGGFAGIGPRAVRLVADVLQQRLPGLADDPPEERWRGPALLLLLDGLGDQPVRALGGRTPLQAAHLPTFDRLAREGRCGLADPVAEGVVPDTASGNLAAFGQSPRAMERGPLEAIGAGFALGPEDVALRANFATLDDAGRVEDRRAGRIRKGTAELARALDELGKNFSDTEDGDEVEIRVRSTTEHRLAIVLRGAGLSSAIRGSDPGEAASAGAPLEPAALDPEHRAAVRTAAILARFELAARDVLSEHPINRKRKRRRGEPPVNALLTRGAGRIHSLSGLELHGAKLSAACVSADRTVLGLATYLGADALYRSGMTANLDTDVEAKLALAAAALPDHDLVVVHFKGADIASHDRRPDLKVEFLERIDAALGAFLDGFEGPLRLAVASDHRTLSESGHHSADPVPILLWGLGIEADQVETFDELAAGQGGLGRFPLQVLIGRLLAGPPVQTGSELRPEADDASAGTGGP